MKKISILVASIAACLSINANAFDLDLNEEVKKVSYFMNSNDSEDDLWVQEERESWINDKEITFQQKALAIQTYVLFKKNSDLHESEKLMLEIMKNENIKLGPWKERNNEIETKVMANDDLISLQRMLYGKINFKEIQARYTVQKDPSSETREVTGNYLSRTLMREGNPPVGPDGRQVRICRLFNVPDATFYELSETQSIYFINGSESNMTIDEACITYKPIYSKYWKNRLGDFIDDQRVEIN